MNLLEYCLYPKMNRNRKINTPSKNMCLPQVGNGRGGSEVTERGKGAGGGYPFPSGSFAFGEGGFKLSDLVHTLRGFLGLIIVYSKITSGKIYIYRICVFHKCACVCVCVCVCVCLVGE